MRKPPKLPPIRVVRERVDEKTDAVLAWCFRVVRRRRFDEGARTFVHRPYLTGASIFVLVPRMHFASIAEAALGDLLRERHGGRLPNVGWCESIPGWGDYE